MDTTFRLKLSRAAAEDLNAIYEYISLNLGVPKAAAGRMQKLDAALHLLCEQPFMCPVCRDTVLREMGYRKLTVESNVIIYLVDEANRTVFIVRAFYGGRDYGRFIR